MPPKDQNIESMLKRSSFISNLVNGIIGIVTAGSVCFGFIFTTKSTIANQEVKIKAMETWKNTFEEKMTNAAVFEGTSKTEIDNMKNTMQRIEDKLDRVLEKK